ncbi:MAG: hypothetical protein VW522_09285 [Candidatus Neomarinimicrobiota bacterium]
MYLARFDHYGLYIIIASFWVAASFIKTLTIPAIWTIVIFMTGFALMRITGITANVPSSYQLSILFIEIFMAILGVMLIKSG